MMVYDFMRGRSDARCESVEEKTMKSPEEKRPEFAKHTHASIDGAILQDVAHTLDDIF